MGPDKILHFLLSFSIALYDPVLSLIAGIAKECYDALSGGAADMYDLIADLAGIACSLL